MVLGQSFAGLLFRIEAGPPINHHGNAANHSSMLRVRDCRRILRGQNYEHSKSGTIRSRVVTGESALVQPGAGRWSGGAPDGVVHDKHDDGANYRDGKTIKIQPGNSTSA